jgi:hypothetical protein
MKINFFVQLKIKFFKFNKTLLIKSKTNKIQILKKIKKNNRFLLTKKKIIKIYNKLYSKLNNFLKKVLIKGMRD